MSQSMADPKRIIVCGGGLSGLVAGITAREAGVPVTLFEKAPETGGNAAISGGVIWALNEYERIRADIPDGDPVLQWLVYENVDAALTWLEAQGAKLGAYESRPELGRRERRMAPAQALAALAERFVTLGGELHTGMGLESLIIEEGAVRGVQLVKDGRTEAHRARAVVIATGGFQGNPELISRYVVRDPDHLYLRGNPWSTGDGLLAGLQAGASASAGLDTFYGHALAAPPARFTKLEFRDYTQWYGQHAVAVNLQGERFADESHGSSEHALNQGLAQQPQGRGFYIVDQAQYEAPAVRGKELLTRVIIERARKAGAPVVVADTLEALCQGLAVHGQPPGRLLRTLREFNELVETDRADDLVPPRRRHRQGLSRAPFYAVGVRASITFTMGGLRVDEQARVLRRAGSSSPLATLPPERLAAESPGAVLAIGQDYRHSAIDGLYAAGTDAGNICHFGYMGGLGPALVTGRTAGAAAAAFVRSGAA
jgi:succinate dehydrogenase/fumarate reductase flavoprotein subunit